MVVRIEHALTPEEAARRLRQAARGLDLEEVEMTDLSASEPGGTFRKATPLGAVTASFTAKPGWVEVRVLEKPAFLPAGTVTKLLQDGLAQALAKE